MDYLLCHADEPSGDSTSLTLWTLAMMHAPETENEMISKGFFREDPIVSLLELYAYYMRIATEDICVFGNTPELFLISRRYSLNIAVYQVDPCSPLHYVLIQEFVGGFNNLKNVVYLFLNGIHYQHIITMDLSYSGNDHHISHLDNTPNDAHVSNDNHHEMDISVAADQSSQDEFVMGQISKFTNINEESTSNVNQGDDLYCQVCNDDSNSIDYQALSTSGQLLNSTHIKSHFLISLLPLKLLINLNTSFLSFAESGTCSNCWRTQYDTSDSTYILEFQTILSRTIRQKCSPLQYLKSTNPQNANAVNFILCNQCYRFLSKDIKSDDFADTYPNFSMESTRW